MEPRVSQPLSPLRALRDLSAMLYEHGDEQSLYQGILDAAVAVMRSDFATIQVLEGIGEGAQLRLLAQRNVPPEAQSFWQTVRLDDALSCADAARSGRRVIVADIERSEGLAGTEDLEVFRRTGIRSMQSTPLLARDGSILGMVSTHWREPREPAALQLLVFDVLARQAADLLERGRWEQQLRDSEARYRTLFESIDEGCCIIEMVFEADRPVDYVFVSVNPAFASQTGLTDAVGRRMLELAPEHEEHWFEIYGEVARTGIPRRFVEQAAALERWFDVYAFPIESPRPPYRVAVLFRDISEQHREQLLKDQFLAIASHELRNPVAAVHGMVQQLRRLEARDDLTPERMRTYLEQMYASSTHLARLTDELTDVSRLQRGTLPLHLESTDIGELVCAVAASEEWPAERIELEVGGEAGVADIDESRIRQVLGNLIDNALKYSDESQPVTVRAHGDDDGFSVEVIDRGVGIPAEFLEAIFDPFGRATNAQNVPGLGMGLYVSREIARRHGGELVATSEGRDRGTTMTLWLPRVPPAEASA